MHFIPWLAASGRYDRLRFSLYRSIPTAVIRFLWGVSTAAISKTVQCVEARREADPSWKSQLSALPAELANQRLPAGSRPTKPQVKT